MTNHSDHSHDHGHDHRDHSPSAELHREQTLHRVVAVSAFLFALCILPVAQYLLIGSETPQGTVAGVATSQPSASADTQTFANVSGDEEIAASPTPALTLVECVRQNEKDTEDLERFLDGKKTAMLRDYERAVDPYRTAQAQLRSGAPASERQALEGLIDVEYQKYLAELTKVESAVTAAQREIDGRVCPAS